MNRDCNHDGGQRGVDKVDQVALDLEAMVVVEATQAAVLPEFVGLIRAGICQSRQREGKKERQELKEHLASNAEQRGMRVNQVGDSTGDGPV